MKLERFSPSPALAPFVKEFIIIESDFGTCSTIIPDTSVVMGFRYRGKVLWQDGGGESPLPAGVITGLRKSVRVLRYEQGTSNLLVVFREGGLAAFTRIPIREWFDQSVPAESLFHRSELEMILESLSEAADHKERIVTLESFLVKKCSFQINDALIHEAVRRIQEQQGVIKIHQLAASLHISLDPFEKRFRALVGSSPKHYANIIRLRTLIDRYPAYPSLTEASLDAGYFDQAHFIRDFKRFTGQTPKAFFRNARYW